MGLSLPTVSLRPSRSDEVDYCPTVVSFGSSDLELSTSVFVSKQGVGKV